ncbi:UNVERIFIED_CONTAM: hypothetical protein FKN15_004724 [Acipenser sinensis]
MVCHRGQLGVAYYDTADYSVHYMPDTQDDFNLKLLDKGSTQDKPEVVLYPSADFGIEISKQRVLSAHLPFVPASLTEAERITYLSSLLPFDCLQMMCAVGGLLRFMERRRVGVELEDSSVRVPILAFKQFLLNNLVYIDHDTYCRWFLRPTRDLAVLNMRQEVIEFFTSPQNNQVLTTLQDCLKNIKGIPAMLRRMTLSNTKVSDWQTLYKPLVSQTHSGPGRAEHASGGDRVLHLPAEQPGADNTTGLPEEHQGHPGERGEREGRERVRAMLRRMTLSNTKVSDWQTLYKISYNAVCIRDTVSSLPQSVQLFREISQAFSEDLHYISSLISKVIGFLLSVPRIPSMDENKDFEIEGLDFMGDDFGHCDYAPFLAGWLPTDPGMNCQTNQYEALCSCYTAPSQIGREIVD